MSWMAVMAVGMASANAQETQKSTPEPAPTPATPKTVMNLWPGAAPGSEQWKQPETTLRPGAIANVTTPTLTVYLPPIPQGLPPFFMAMAQDDNLAGRYIVRFYEALKAAGYRPEFHIYNSGGHGWGMRKQGKSSDHWIDEFYYWLEAQGLTRPLKQP